jgi:hypothetical protein
MESELGYLRGGEWVENNALETTVMKIGYLKYTKMYLQ